MSLRIIEDGSIGKVERGPRVVLPPVGGYFAERAARFEQLATGNVLAAYLQLMARVARAQHRALAARQADPPAATVLEQSRMHGMPPLAALSHRRAAQWCEDLSDIVQGLRAEAAGSHTAALDALTQLDHAAVEAVADRILSGHTLDGDAAFVPFVGAALQVYFARMAATLASADVDQCDVATVCPVCGTRPVASVVRIGPGRESLRYLHCALCDTEWNMVRVKCSACESEKSVHYLSVDSEMRVATEAVVKAETCDECHGYLKIFNQERDPHVDAMADDLATLALDVSVDEHGYVRTGPNLLFHPGSG
ncbi:MAG TPA: formate dehydrogenase accessory protein FdhE [Burkholderiaceae bacterium]|nr:formate dehydrogenase accessory protein FdhE [Burkholderiaceae bacterium]